MKKIISFTLVLMMFVSAIPLATADNWYDGTPAVTPTAGTELNEDTVVVKGEEESDADKQLENEIAEDNVIVQYKKNSDGIETITQSTVDVVTPESTPDPTQEGATSNHTRSATASSTGTIYVPVDETYHAEAKLYVCEDCGLEYSEYTGNKAEHSFVNGVCSECGYTESIPSPSPTIYNITDANGKKVTASYSDGTMTFSGSENGAEIPDYEEKTVITEDNGTETSTESTLTPTTTPWQEIASAIKVVIVDKTIKRIGDWSLAMLENLKAVFIEGDNVEIGDFAFAGDTELENVNVTSKSAVLTYDNSDGIVDDQGKEYSGSTAYYGDGTVSVNYNCQNTNTDQKNTQFADADVQYGCFHNNPVTVSGYAPTETDFGMTDGIYCKDCKTWITFQTKIYPNGKPETGTFEFINILTKSDLKDIPAIIKGTALASKFDTNDKLDRAFKEDLETAYKEILQGGDMPNNAYVVYEVIQTSGSTPDGGVYIFNIPYPQGTYPDSYEYVVLQLQDDGTTKQLKTFMTNTGIQVETSTLMPVGVAWKS